MWEDARRQAEADGVDLEDAADVIRDGNKVRVYMYSPRRSSVSSSSPCRQGDEVTVYVTNIDDVEDLTHGFTISITASTMEVGPQADGVHNLHSRPAGRLLVLLPVVLPRAAYGDEGSHAGRAALGLRWLPAGRGSAGRRLRFGTGR
jgi:hypothetical protein